MCLVEILLLTKGVPLKRNQTQKIVAVKKPRRKGGYYRDYCGNNCYLKFTRNKEKYFQQVKFSLSPLFLITVETGFYRLLLLKLLAIIINCTMNRCELNIHTVYHLPTISITMFGKIVVLKL